MNSFTKEDIDKDFGQTIKEYRVKAGLTQEQLSEELGISLKYISRLENGYGGIKNISTLSGEYNFLATSIVDLLKNNNNK